MRTAGWFADRLEPVADPPPVTARTYLLDVGLAGVVLALSVLPLLGVGDSGCDCQDRPAWAYLAVGAQAVPLVWRRRWPFTCGVVVLVATVVYGIANLPDPVVPFGGLVGLYSVAAYARPVLSYASLAAGIVAVPIAVSLSTTSSDALDYINPLFELVTAWSLGYASAARRRQASALAERTRQLERAVAAEGAALAAEERAQIAREMHDVVAHAITLMVVQAEAGPVALETGGGQAAFDAIGRIGRHALGELRRVLAALRPAEGSSQRAPQPDIADLAGLVDDAVAAGAPAQLEVHGDLAGLPRPVTLAAYRIVQESLTNAIRYAPGQPTRVLIQARDADLDIAIDTDGEVVANGSMPGAGRGLAGMQERASALGGSFMAGPRAGGWQVRVRIPLAPASPASNPAATRPKTP